MPPTKNYKLAGMTNFVKNYAGERPPSAKIAGKKASVNKARKLRKSADYTMQ